MNWENAVTSALMFVAYIFIHKRFCELESWVSKLSIEIGQLQMEITNHREALRALEEDSLVKEKE